MTEPEPEAEIVSLAERRKNKQIEAAEARREQARNQARVEPGELPPPRMTHALIAINLVVWIVMVALGVDPYEPSGTALIDYGGNLGIRTSNGQWWRLLTAMFVHGGIIHLGFNLYFMWAISRACEQIFGPAAFTVVYFGSGLIASMVSVAWQPAIVSVGASGALFGVFGAFMGFTIRRRGTLPPEFVTMVRRNALILIGLNLAIGVAMPAFKTIGIDVPNIDVAAHIGGLVAGLGQGYVIARLAERPVSTKAEAKAVRLRATGAAAAAAIVVLIAGGLGLPRWDDPFPALEAAQDRYNELVTAYEAAGDDLDARVELLEQRGVPAMAQTLDELDALDELPRRGPARETVAKWRRHYELRGQAFAKEIEGLREGDQAALSAAEALHVEAVAALDSED